jgi:predicted RecA/RadA family phage recombinase
MKNQVFIGTPTSPRFSICPITVKSGDPVLLGSIPAVALDDYQANEGGTTFYANGTFALMVMGRSSQSPVVAAAIKPGGKIYAVGTLDTATNVTTDLTLDANSSSGVLFGTLDPQYQTSVGSGLTDTAAWVRI